MFVLDFALIHVDTKWLQRWFSYVAFSTYHQRGIPGHLSLDHSRGCHVAGPLCIHVESMWLFYLGYRGTHRESTYKERWLIVSYVATSTFRPLKRDTSNHVERKLTKLRCIIDAASTSRSSDTYRPIGNSTVYVDIYVAHYMESTEIIYVLSIESRLMIKQIMVLYFE